MQFFEQREQLHNAGDTVPPTPPFIITLGL